MIASTLAALLGSAAAVLVLVLSSCAAGWLIGAWITGDLSKTYPPGFVPGPKFRAGKSKNPEK